MNTTTPLRTGRHCKFEMHVHLVFVTKYRHEILDENKLRFLQDVFQDICEMSEATLVEMNGECDHVHLLINYPPKIAIAKLVNSLKGVSSRLLKKCFPDILQHYWKGAFWSPSYYAGSCGGGTIEVIRQYIQAQASPATKERLISPT